MSDYTTGDFQTTVRKKPPKMLAKEGPLAAVRESDAWRTPRMLFDFYNSMYKFSLDAAARGADALCKDWIGPDHPNLAPGACDALSWQAWVGPFHAVWVNPPYSQAGGGLAKWMEIAAATGVHIPCVALVPATPSTSWFEDAMHSAYRVDLFKRRVAFDTPEGKPSSSPRGDVCAFHFLPHTWGPARLQYVDLEFEQGLRETVNNEIPF